MTAFCILPFLHVMLHQDGKIQTCCRGGELAHAYGSLQAEPFEKIWNGPAARSMRCALLEGNALPQCETCYREEAQGKASLRTTSLEQFKESLHLSATTAPDGTVPGEQLRYLGLRLSNHCNLRCRTCSPGSSSAWAQDGLALSGKNANNETTSLDEGKLWQTLTPLLPQLKQIYFAGGEPLLHKMHYRILEELLACGRTNLSLVYNSNLSVLKFQNWDISALWSRFRQVEVNVSFDGIFAQSDLLRNNSSWLQLEANFETLRRTLPGLHLKINPTASVMNAFHLIPALQYWIERGFLKNPGDLTLNILDFPRHFNLQILNLAERSRLKSELTRFLDKLAAKLNPEFHQSLVVELRPLLALCDSPVYFEAERQIFRTVTFKLDRLRKEKFVDHFPEHFGLLYE